MVSPRPREYSRTRATSISRRQAGEDRRIDRLGDAASVVFDGDDEIIDQG
jgi:hypothetical protein